MDLIKSSHKSSQSESEQHSAPVPMATEADLQDPPTITTTGPSSSLFSFNSIWTTLTGMLWRIWRESYVNGNFDFCTQNQIVFCTTRHWNFLGKTTRFSSGLKKLQRRQTVTAFMASKSLKTANWVSKSYSHFRLPEPITAERCGDSPIDRIGIKNIPNSKTGETTNPTLSKYVSMESLEVQWIKLPKSEWWTALVHFSNYFLG